MSADKLIKPHQFHIHHERKDAVVQPSGPSPLWRKVGDALATLALVLSALCLGVVALVVVLSSVWLMTGKDGNLTQSMIIYTFGDADTLGILVAGFVCAVGVFLLARMVWQNGARLDGAQGTKLLLVATFAFQLIIILAMQTRDTYWGDSWMIRDFVDKALEKGSIAAIFTGKYDTLFYDARLYFSCYPFQAGLFWLMYGLKLVFGDFSYMAFQVLAALGVEAGVMALVMLGKSMGLGERGMRVLKLLVMLCLPMYWLSTFIYGNALGCGLALVFLALQALAMREVWDGSKSWRALMYVGASLPALVFALIVKETFVLFVIAVIIAWVVVAIRSRRAWEFLACIVVVLLARAISGLPFAALAQASGGYEFTGSITTLNHLELGLRMGHGEFYVSVNRGDLTYAPGGWSNYANAIWEESSGDAEIQNASAMASLEQDLAQFVANPSYALWFFTVKLATEWADPTYQSLYYLSMCGLMWGDGGRANPADVASPLGLVCTLLTFVEDGYQTIVFPATLGAVVVAIKQRKTCKYSPVALLLALTFFTGFGCYLLWEAKAVYVLPFAIVAIPLAAAGLDVLIPYTIKGSKH